MSPGALAARKRRLGHEKYKRKKISLIRRKANLMRLDRHGCGDGDNGSRENIGEHVEELEDKEDFEEEENEEVEEEENDKNKKVVSAKTVARRRKDFLNLLPAEFMLKVELLKMLVQDFEVKEILIDD